MKKILAVAAAAVAAALVFAAATVPPRRLALDPLPDGTVAGAMHVHTNRSDGSSSPEQVAAAAARAGLRFVVFTDHGDATRAPDPPSYRSGVLCLDGVEISTSGGHYIALDMPKSPYPLGGEPRDVVQDVGRLGGFGIAAHPDSPKLQLQWEDWTLPIDGVELLNLDTSWRMLAGKTDWSSRRQLLIGLFDYPFRPAESMARLIQPTAALPRWDAVNRTRRLVTVAGADAHAKLAPPNADPGDARFALPLPSYESSFRVLSVHVRPQMPLSGDAGSDAALIYAAIRSGHLYTAVDGLATPPAFEFSASNAAGAASQGDALAVNGAVTLRVRSNAPANFTTLAHDGLRTIATVRDGQDVTVHAGESPAVYWAEVVSPEPQAITWIRSNPIYVRAPAPRPVAPSPAPPSGTVAVFDGRTTTGWTTEHAEKSLAAVEGTTALAGSELRYRFGLASGPAVGQYTSLILTLPEGVEPFDAVRFRVRAEKTDAPVRAGAHPDGGQVAALGLCEPVGRGTPGAVRRSQGRRHSRERRDRQAGPPKRDVRGGYGEHQPGHVRPDLGQRRGADQILRNDRAVTFGR